MITFSHLVLKGDLFLYSSGNGVDYTLADSFNYKDMSPGSVPIALNGSAYVQFFPGGEFSFDYVCVDATPAPTTDAPPTLVPGVDRICQEYTVLNDAGHVDYVQNTDPAVCWHIACDKEVVITFTWLTLYGNTVLDLYSSSNDTYTLEKHMTTSTPTPERGVGLNGSAFLQFVNGKDSSLSFDYVCMDPTPVPATAAPPTLVPGVGVCQWYADLNETAGNVTAVTSVSGTWIQCWHIGCNTHSFVEITFTSLKFDPPTFLMSSLDLYSSGNGVDYTFADSFNYYSMSPGSVPIVLNGSAYVQLAPQVEDNYNISFDYVCTSGTPQPTTESPPTLAPGVVVTNLNETAGKVDFVSSMDISVECWYIECNNSVMITFTTLSLENWAYLELFSSESENGTIHYTPERIISHSDSTGSGFVLNGPALVQFIQNYGLGENDASKVGFNYMCIGSPQPATEAPPTLVPGVEYVCQNHTDLNDTSGKVSYMNHEANNTACWHIECDKSVAITFSYMQVYAQSFLYLYSSGSTSGSATHYTLEKVLFSPAASTGVEYLLDGSALMQFRSDTHAGRTELDFEYVCQSADKDDGGHSTWPYVVFPVVGVLSLALGVVALLKSGVFKAKVSKSSLKDGVNNNEGASVIMLEESPVM